MPRPSRRLMIKNSLDVLEKGLLKLTESALAMLGISNLHQNENGDPWYTGVTFKLPAEHVDKLNQILNESYQTMQSEIANLRDEWVSMTKKVDELFAIHSRIHKHSSDTRLLHDTNMIVHTV